MENTYDFIIVGAGPSGCILASRLAKSAANPSVLLLEAGGPNSELADLSADERFNIAFKPDSPLNWGYKVHDERGREIDYSRGKGLGGSTAINFCGWVTGPSADYDEWARQVDDSAFGWANVQRHLASIVTLHRGVPKGFRSRIKPSEGHGTAGPIHLGYSSDWQRSVHDVFLAAEQTGHCVNADVNDGDPMGMGMGTVCIHDGVRMTAADAFLSDPPSNLTILTSCIVSQVLMNGFEMRGVQTADGPTFLARKEVVLCGGSINSPQLLQLSGIGPSDFLGPVGIDVLHDLSQVGRNLQDHCFSVAGIVVDDQPERIAKQTPSPMGWFKLDGLRRSLEYANLPAATKRHLEAPTVPDWELVTHTPLLDSLATSPDEQLMTAMAILENPQSRGIVRIVSKDPLAAPHIDPKFLSHPYDRRALTEAFKEMMRWLEAPVWERKTTRRLGWPDDESDEGVLRTIRSRLASSWHMCGTVRMGREPRNACVDADFKIFGTSGLRVADMSVCPFVPNNHTQSTAYVIGAIAAEKLITCHCLDRQSKICKL